MLEVNENIGVTRMLNKSMLLLYDNASMALKQYLTMMINEDVLLISLVWDDIDDVYQS